ncbi:MAG: MBL fold metallo-hydrolase [Myxococcota bacterium]
MARAQWNDFRRRLAEVEEACFLGTPLGEAEATALLGSAVAALGVAAPQPRVADRVRDAAALAAGRMSRVDYRDRHGACGLRRFRSIGGTVIYLVPVETLPGLVNNLYLLRTGERVALFDAGSGTHTCAEELDRAARVLQAVFEERDLLSRVEDVIISHAHIDHFGGLRTWKERGARVHVHALDRRVIERFEERIIVAAADVRIYLERAGVSDHKRLELAQMYVASKNFYRSVEVDHALEDGVRIGPLVAHHTPGHCPGHVCLQVDNVLLTGDHVLSNITPHQSPESITPWTGLGHYLESLEKVRRLPAIDLALGGHEEPVTLVAQRIADIERFHRERLDKVKAICREQKTVAEITAELFGEQTGYGQLLALEEAGAHVEYLAQRSLLEIANVEDFAKSPNPPVKYRAIDR